MTVTDNGDGTLTLAKTGDDYAALDFENHYEASKSITLAGTKSIDDIDSDPDRWYGYDAGWPTNGFESKSELIKIAKKVAELRFPEGWNIIVEDNS